MKQLKIANGEIYYRFKEYGLTAQAIHFKTYVDGMYWSYFYRLIDLSKENGMYINTKMDSNKVYVPNFLKVVRI